MTQPSQEAEIRKTNSLPFVIELTAAPSIQSSLEKLRDLPGCLLLDSSMQLQSVTSQPLGRYSFLMADPFENIVVPLDSQQPFDQLRQLLETFETQSITGLPPMQGGVAGLFSYDLNRSIEDIVALEHDQLKLPAIVAGAYDTVVAWDHEQNRTWIISQGFPEQEEHARQKRAESRASYFKDLITAPTKQKVLSAANDKKPLDDNLFRSFNVDGPAGLKSNFSREGYLAAVQKCIDYIHAGDVFQINLAQRLLLPARCDSVELYQRLRQCNPAPFSAYFDINKICDCNAQIISASPERLISVRDEYVETRPIKGTRKRTGNPLVDIEAKKQLLASEKDRAENTMIVDLMRNDLSRVCNDDSIAVTQLCELEQYQSVMHLVSAVQGKLNPENNLVDLLAAVFPGGSITGAPKVRAMEIISELEPTARGAYCGSLGYLGFDGSADLNILIRTITSSNGWWQIPVGGGIVSQSNPQREYDETWTKAAGMLRAATMDTTQDEHE